MPETVFHLTSDQLAQRLGCSVRTVERLRITGSGPKFIRLARKVIYPLHAVEAWEASRLHASRAAEFAARAAA
jgi:predicted DNA-binding transcriptional regulator AlpA